MDLLRIRGHKQKYDLQLKDTEDLHKWETDSSENKCTVCEISFTRRNSQL